MRIFSGFRTSGGGTMATVVNPNGSTTPLADRNWLWAFPRSYDWGAVNEEAKSLALAILHEATGSDNVSLYFAEMFAKGVVSMLPHSAWQLAETAVLKWLINVVESEVFGTASVFDKGTQEAIANG